MLTSLLLLVLFQINVMILIIVLTFYGINRIAIKLLQKKGQD